MHILLQLLYSCLPLGGRWHGKAVTDEGRGQLKVTDRF